MKLPRLSTFLCSCHSLERRHYGVLRNYALHANPHAKTFQELMSYSRHFEPDPSAITQRFHFHRRDQAVTESIAEFVAELRRLSTHCRFSEERLDESIRDRFVCGLRSASIQRRLLTEKDLTLNKAVEVALAMEAADREAKTLKGTDAVVQRLQRLKSADRPLPPCYSCGRKGHGWKNCRFRDATCYRCGKVGHIAPVCRSDKKQSRRQRDDDERSLRQDLVAEEQPESGSRPESESSDSEFHLNPIFVLGSRSSKPIEVDLVINDKPVTMELDTGAAVTIMSQRQQRSLFPDALLQPSNIRLKSYTGERVEIVGEMSVKVSHKSEQQSLSLTVVAQDGPALLGRNWLSHVMLDWKTISAVYAKRSSELETLITTYADVFKDELGTIEFEDEYGVRQPMKVRLHIRPQAKPKFCRPRPLPFAIKGAIDQELDRLESSGIIQKVPCSEWAAPIVTVPKQDGRYRICGDYKVTINPAMDVEQYPLPTPQALYATLAGGKTFSKLDLQQAYLQLPLDDESRKYVTVNTHRGLYQYNRLPFGVASAPAVFQRTMDTILQGVPGVICYIDDILVTGSCEAEHLQRLEQVLQRLQKHGVRLRKSKCAFLQPSVEYLGHKVDAEGIHPTQNKLQAVLDAPAPKNVQQLRSFLGLLNYYGNFVANLATILHPLNKLLQKDCRWHWSSECARAFQAAKEGLTSSQVLLHYDPTLPIKVAADASAYGLGAVLSHVLPDNSERPIAFASRSLSQSEKNYAQIEKEALALIFAVKKFHQFLYGRKFTLLTDHKPLLAILGSKSGIPSLAAARLQRWAVILSAYSYQLVFKPTQSHGNADGLSRLPLPEIDSTSPVPSCFNICQIQALPVTSDAVQTATRRDPLLSKVLYYTKHGWPTRVSDAFKPFQSRRLELTVEGGCLLWGMRVIVPRSLQEPVLRELHRSHPGVSRMKSLARSFVWWPGLDKAVENMASSCSACQAVKQAPATAPLHPWIWPTKPWQRIHVDFAGPFMGKTYLIVVDAHSKWPEVHEMSMTTSSKTISVLRHLFAQYGLPEQLVSDNGPQFTSDDFAQFLRSNGVKHIRCSPYHPSSNGAAERLVRTFKQAMKASHLDGLTPHHRLENFLLAYRTTPHTTTGEAPCKLFLGRDLRTRLDLLLPGVQRKVTHKQAQQKLQHDQHAKMRELEPGERVMVRDKRPNASSTWIPGVIVQQHGPLTFLVDVGQGLLWRRHLDHLKQFPSDDDFGPSLTPASPPGGAIPSPSDTSTTITSTSQAAVQTETERRYPSRVRRSPDRYCDTYMYT